LYEISTIYFPVSSVVPKTTMLFFISNFCRVLNVACFLLCNSPASEFYKPTFRNTLSFPSSQAPMKMKQTECSELLLYKIQTPGNCPEESIQPCYLLHKIKLQNLLHSAHTKISAFLGYGRLKSTVSPATSLRSFFNRV